MLTLELKPELERQVRQEAQRREVPLEDLIIEWIENQLWEAGNQKIDEEMDRFIEQHETLLPKYRGKYIAMRDGVVLDQDEDLIKLHDRIRDQYGDEPILMTLVDKEPIQTFRMLSPRLVQGLK